MKTAKIADLFWYHTKVSAEDQIIRIFNDEMKESGFDARDDGFFVPPYPEWFRDVWEKSVPYNLRHRKCAEVFSSRIKLMAPDTRHEMFRRSKLEFLCSLTKYIASRKPRPVLGHIGHVYSGDLFDRSGSVRPPSEIVKINGKNQAGVVVEARVEVVINGNSVVMDTRSVPNRTFLVLDNGSYFPVDTYEAIMVSIDGEAEILDFIKNARFSPDSAGVFRPDAAYSEQFNKLFNRVDELSCSQYVP